MSNILEPFSVRVSFSLFYKYLTAHKKCISSHQYLDHIYPGTMTKHPFMISDSRLSLLQLQAQSFRHVLLTEFSFSEIRTILGLVTDKSLISRWFAKVSLCKFVNILLTIKYFFSKSLILRLFYETLYFEQ